MLKFFLLILAVLIVLSLAGYLLKLWWQIRTNKKLLEQAKHERMARVKESIDVIARAMLSDQCDLSEGVLRLKPLLDVLGVPLSQYKAMWELYLVVEEMPILDARKSLKRNERMKLDLEREAKEAELESQIKQELRQLLDNL